ncbi:MAG TPA: universal stress protein, partial [Mycobacterium sp.]|nr:universal stress protein [Mycobacterium sp.]
MSHNKGLGVVVGVDGSAPSRAALDWAAHDAKMRNLPLTLVCAVPIRATRWPARIWFEALGWLPYERARRVLDDAVRVVQDGSSQGGPPRVIAKVVLADPAAALVDLSRDAEVIVVGARRRGAVRRRLFGSVSSSVLRQSCCPVAVIHDEDPLIPDLPHAPVLASYDGSAAAAILARQEASQRGVDLIVSDQSASGLIEQAQSTQLVALGDFSLPAAAIADKA